MEYFYFHPSSSVVTNFVNKLEEGEGLGWWVRSGEWGWGGRGLARHGALWRGIGRAVRLVLFATLPDGLRLIRPWLQRCAADIVLWGSI